MLYTLIPDTAFWDTITMLRYSHNNKDLLTGQTQSSVVIREAYPSLDWMMASMNIRNCISLDEILLASRTEPERLHVLNFWASWAEPCMQMNEIFSALALAHPDIHFWDVDAETIADVSVHFLVEAVPTFVFIKDGKEFYRVNGAKGEELTKAIEDVSAKAIKDASTPQDLNSRLVSLINQHKVMLFIKGTPSAPRCGFTRQLLSLLHAQRIEYNFFDILADETVRQGLKVYSSWPTYPQVYVNGELVGGLDIVQEMIETDQFMRLTE